MNENDTFSYIMMLSKSLKWALKSGIAIGLIGRFGLNVDHLLDLILASSVAIGILTSITNVLKHRFNWKWLP